MLGVNKEHESAGERGVSQRTQRLLDVRGPLLCAERLPARVAAIQGELHLLLVCTSTAHTGVRRCKGLGSVATVGTVT